MFPKILCFSLYRSPFRLARCLAFALTLPRLRLCHGYCRYLAFALTLPWLWLDFALTCPVLTLYCRRFHLPYRLRPPRRPLRLPLHASSAPLHRPLRRTAHSTHRPLRLPLRRPRPALLLSSPFRRIVITSLSALVSIRLRIHLTSQPFPRFKCQMCTSLLRILLTFCLYINVLFIKSPQKRALPEARLSFYSDLI